MLAEGSGKALLCTKHNEAAFRMLRYRRGAHGGGQKVQCFPDGTRNDVGIGNNAGKQRAPLLGAGGGDAAHGGDNGRELPHVLNLRGDIR